MSCSGVASIFSGADIPISILFVKSLHLFFTPNTSARGMVINRNLRYGRELARRCREQS